MITEITPVELRDLLDTEDPLVLVDVRQPDEYTAGHVPGAELMPMDTVPARVPDLRSAVGPIYLICLSGSRSHHVAQFLAQQGIDAINVSGGTAAWYQLGLPVVAGTAP